MKAVILAGGLGTRLSEETESRPKPMVEIGGKPILWHIMKIYSAHGINDFVICLGYKGYVIKEFFANYFMHTADVTFHMQENRMQVHELRAEPWNVTLVDTGHDSMTGGRLKRVGKYLTEEEDFCFTYGDGVADIDITSEIAFHRAHGKMATLAAVRPAGRFGALDISNDDQVSGFTEKPPGDGGMINGGFFVLSSKVLDLIESDNTSWEMEPLQRLASMDELRAWRHDGFWQPMDTIREKNQLDDLVKQGNAPWVTWPT